MSWNQDQSVLEQAAYALAEAESVAVLTGAGVSAESGVPTFRGPGGLWKQYRAEELATPGAFARDPALVWEFYNFRRNLIGAVRPNPAHLVLADLEAEFGEFTLVTQNVDGLHHQGGSGRVLELHGNIWRVRCTKCGREVDRVGEQLPPLPSCADCGGLLRPGVVWFGESLPVETWNEAERAVRQCDCMLVVGTSALVHPAAGLAWLAHRAGAQVIEVNLEPTPASNLARLGLYGSAGEILPELANRFRRLRGLG